MPIVSYPITRCYWEGFGSFFFLHLWFFYTLSEFPMSFLFCWAAESQLSQPLLICQISQGLRHLCSSFWNSLQFVHICCSGKLRNEPRSAAMSYQCLEEGRDHLPQPASNTLCDAAQEAVGLLSCEGWWLAYIHLGVHAGSLVLVCRDAVQLLATPSRGACGYFSPGAGVDISLSWTS